jgi:hypothetical protein
MKPAPEFDRGSIARAADELEEHYRAAFEDRGGRLSVRAGTDSDIRTRTKTVGLHAGVEWDSSRRYDHVHAGIARRTWFSRRWQTNRTVAEAADRINSELAAWLREAR